MLRIIRQLVVEHAVEFSAAGLGGAASPLLEEEGYARCLALVAEAAHPGFVHRAGVGAALPARDQPVDRRQVQFRQRSEQGLGADEPHLRRNGAQVIHPEGVAVVFYAHAHPDVGRPVQVLREGGEPLGALGEYLVGVPGRVGHDLEHPPDEVQRHLWVEQVAHRVHEDQPGRPPPVGRGQRFLVQGQGEAGAAGPRVSVVLVLGQPHRLEALGEREGVAVVTPRRDPVASRSGVPGGVGPLDARPVAHDPFPPIPCLPRYSSAMTQSPQLSFQRQLLASPHRLGKLWPHQRGVFSYLLQLLQLQNYYRL